MLPFAAVVAPQAPPLDAWRTVAEAHGQVAGADLASRLDRLIGLVELLVAQTAAAPATLPLADESERPIDQEELGALLKVSVRTVRRMEGRGELPPSIAGGRQRLYLRDEIDRWLRQGQPPRKEWEARGRK
ncbi:MAG TPA: helix-turn-helix domain-containing protein [Acidimicrobiales bacterium]|nr:helix-turn-helix domain-containing protein [Acidimicrobiales bacterium]